MNHPLSFSRYDFVKALNESHRRTTILSFEPNGLLVLYQFCHLVNPLLRRINTLHHDDPLLQSASCLTSPPLLAGRPSAVFDAVFNSTLKSRALKDIAFKTFLEGSSPPLLLSFLLATPLQPHSSLSLQTQSPLTRVVLYKTTI